jgi:hypothetical protein
LYLQHLQLLVQIFSAWTALVTVLQAPLVLAQPVQQVLWGQALKQAPRSATVARN